MKEVYEKNAVTRLTRVAGYNSTATGMHALVMGNTYFARV
tara:strand:+ start:303 stop:422 length:120 start_codon:yes stop_codon:yes gene_type:complete